MRRKPYAVILLDEIEKAHPDTFNMLLQILDEGHLTDAKGRKVNFKNTVVIMTSNIGSDLLLQSHTAGSIGFRGVERSIKREDEEVREKIMELLREQFRPEFLNRVDEIIMFHSLGETEIAEIIELQLEQLSRRLKKQRRITLTVTTAAKKLIAEKGYDPSFGARPLRRVIQTLILNPLSLKLITGEVAEGESIQIGTKGEEILLTKQAEKELVKA